MRITPHPRGRSLSLALGLVIGASFLVTGGSAAHAVSQAPDGLWYVDHLGLDKLGAEVTGKDVTIAVIDRAIHPKAAELRGANVTVKGSTCSVDGKVASATSDDVELAGRGTTVASLIVGNGEKDRTRGIAPDAELWFYGTGPVTGCDKYDLTGEKLYDPVASKGTEDFFVGDSAAYAAFLAIKDGADVVVYAGIDDDLTGWASATILALREDVPLLAATPTGGGISHERTGVSYPFATNGVIAIGGITPDRKLLSSSWPLARGERAGVRNMSFVAPAADILIPHDGTSWDPTVQTGPELAVPLVAGAIALGMEQHPKLPASQILHMMVGTAEGQKGDGVPRWASEKLGFGSIMPPDMLAADPDIYDSDYNPSFVRTAMDARCLDPELEEGEYFGTMEFCNWSSYPAYKDVWPAEPDPDDTTGPTAAGDAFRDAWGVVNTVVIAAVSIVALVFVGAMLYLLLLKRKNKKRMRIVQEHTQEEQP